MPMPKGLCGTCPVWTCARGEPEHGATVGYCFLEPQKSVIREERRLARYTGRAPNNLTHAQMQTRVVRGCEPRES